VGGIEGFYMVAKIVEMRKKLKLRKAQDGNTLITICRQKRTGSRAGNGVKQKSIGREANGAAVQKRVAQSRLAVNEHGERRTGTDPQKRRHRE